MGRMSMEVNTGSAELGEIIRVIDESVRMLNRYNDEHSIELVQEIWTKVEWSLERLVYSDSYSVYSPLYEVVYFLDLACFSVIKMHGDSFPDYLREVNSRYRLLLRRLYTSTRKQKQRVM
jgi:hypothetical protein